MSVLGGMRDAEDLVVLGYQSKMEGTRVEAQKSIEEIMVQSNENNRKRGISGMLIYDGVKKLVTKRHTSLRPLDSDPSLDMTLAHYRYISSLRVPVPRWSAFTESSRTMTGTQI